MKELEIIATDSSADIENESVGIIFNEFEGLFNPPDDAVKLDLTVITGAPIGEILIDAVMYDDDELFEQSLKLLERRFGQRRKLLECLDQVYLLDEESIPIFQTVHILQTRLSTLIYGLRSSQVWGVLSVVSGDFDEQMFTFIQSVCNSLLLFLSGEKDGSFPNHTGPINAVKHHQNILRSLDLHSVLITGQKIDINISFKGSKCTIQEKLKSQRMLISTLENVLQVTLYFLCGNKENQELMFNGVLEKLTELCFATLSPLPLRESNTTDDDENYPTQNPNSSARICELSRLCIIELCRGNVSNARRLPEKIFDVFGNFLNDEKERDLTICKELPQ